VTVIETFRMARSTRVRKPRESIVLRLARLLGSRLPSASQVRTVVLQVSGIGFIDYSAMRFNATLGVLAIGVSLLVIEALSGE
jgi:hypothetical protein